jgi:hypothetical protein
LQHCPPSRPPDHGKQERRLYRYILPTDYIIWNEKVAEAILDSNSKTGSNSSMNYVIWTSGDFSTQATTKLQKADWTLHPKTTGKLMEKNRKAL